MLNIPPDHLPCSSYDHLLPNHPPPSFYMKYHQYPLPITIELVEVPPPTPRPLSSLIPSSSYSSSSAGSEDDDDDEDEGLSESEMDLEDDPQVDDMSYCSSDMDRDDDHTPQSLQPKSSFQRCIKRILQWRERSFHPEPQKQEPIESDTRIISSAFDEPQPFKRASSSSSSASRSSMLSTSSSFTDPAPFSIASRRYSTSSSITSAELEFHPCPACDAFFPTQESLRAHGLATGNEACCVAVEYAFEK